MFLIYQKTKFLTKRLPIFEFDERFKLAVIPVDLEAPFVRAFEESMGYPFR